MSSNNKRKRSTQEEMDKRVSTVLDLMGKIKNSPQKIKEILIQTYSITKKTADRDIRHARKILRGLGLQASAEERGLLITRLENIHSEIQASAKDNFPLRLQLLRLEHDICKSNPNYNTKEQNTHDNLTHTHAATGGLPPELKAAIERHGLFEQHQPRQCG